MKTFFAFLLAVLSVSSALAQDSTLEAKIRDAMASDLRTPEEVARDANRKPVETLQFFGLKDDMKIVELIPGGGWYTKLLVPVMAENGEYYVALGTNGVKQSVLSLPGFEKAQVVAEDAKIYRAEGSRLLSLDLDSLGVKDADMVLTFRNYHNFTAEARATLDRAVYDALKPGGIYAVVDHHRRHMEPDNPENGRRVDPVLAIREIQAAGFEFVDFSDLHYRPDDELRYEVGRKTVTGNTDRWTFKFRKPEK